MTVTRHRCTQCDQIVEERRLVEHRRAAKARIWLAMVEEQGGHELGAKYEAARRRELEARFHIVNALGSRRAYHCGPVEVETSSDYQDQLEHWLGVTF